MASELIAGLGAIKTAFDLAKGLKDIDDATRRNAAVIELQEKILSAQMAQATLIERVGDLEKEVTRFETWDTEKKKYELKELYSGFFCYILKEAEEAGEAAHAICANCYQRGSKSILQSNGEPQMFRHAWHCPACKTTVKCPNGNIREMITNVRKTA